MICGGEEYSNAYEGRRPSLRLPSRTYNAFSLTFRLSLSYRSLLAVLPLNSIATFRIHTGTNTSCIWRTERKTRCLMEDRRHLLGPKSKGSAGYRAGQIKTFRHFTPQLLVNDFDKTAFAHDQTKEFV